MMSRSIRKTFRINNERRLGKVLIIAEGETEVQCLRRIFNGIFGYKVVKVNKASQCHVFKSDQSGTLVVVANACSSNIKSVLDDTERERIVLAAQKEVGESFRNYRIYYIWDRDEKSNIKEDVNKAISKLGNPQMNDNGVYEGGLLLLSYPCYESFLISNYMKRLFLNMHPKDYIKGDLKKKINYRNINEVTLMKATKDMVEKCATLEIDCLLDDYVVQNSRLFRKEEEILKAKNEYLLMSQISLLMLDLGLIEIDDPER